MGIQRRFAVAGTVAAAAMALAACGVGGGGGDAANSSAGRPAAPQAVPNQVDHGGGHGGGALSLLGAARNAQLGSIVVDDAGRTLYRFDKDTASPSASNCAGQCATTWPPALVAGGKVAIRGIDSALVGKIKRADGTYQLTLGGWPLYRFAKDAAPGDILGQGVGGTWFVSAPDGKKALSPAQQQAPAQGGGYGGY